MKRVALYVRVSTQEQKKHGLSVDNQIVALREYCAENGYIEAGLYNDAGISARKTYTKRPALLQLMKDCEAGKIDLILFTKLDRWFRSVGDYYEVQRVLDAANVPWRSIWEDYETETSSGIFKVNIMLSVAQSEADRTAERIRAVKEYQRSMGLFCGGVAPFGYYIENNNLYIKEDEREITRKIFDTFLLTRSITKVLEMLRENGHSRSRNGVYIMLKNPTYAGDAHGYKCPAYITEAERATILKQIGVNKTGRKERTNDIYLFNGMVRCGICGKPMAGTYSNRTKADGSKVHYIYYRCTAFTNRDCSNKKNMSELKIEKYLIENLETQFELYKSNIQSDKDFTADNEKKISALEGRLKRIGERFEDGDITRDEYRQKRDDIKLQISSLKNVAQPKLKEIPEGWYDIYKNLDKEHQKYFWNNIIDKIVIGAQNTDISFSV